MSVPSNKILAKPSAYAWIIFLLSASFLFYKYILQVSPAVMTNNLMQVYSLTGTALGFLVGFYFYTYMLMQIPSGILLDKYGPRKLTSVAILLCAVGTLIFSQTNSFAVACLGRLLVGLGAAFATTSYMKLSSNWFPPRYFALLSGLFGTACMTGAGTAEAPLAWLVNHVGWRGTLIYCALAGFIMAFLFWIFVRNSSIQFNFSHLRNESSDGDPRGELPLLPFGNPKGKRPAASGGVLVNNYELPQENLDEAKEFNFRNLINLFRNKSNWPLIFYGGFAFTPVSVFGGLWGVPYIMAAYHLPKTSAASSVSLAFFGFAIGSLIIGWIGKQVQKQLPIVIIGTSIALLFLAVVLYIPYLPLWLLNTSIFLFGFSASSFVLSYTIAKNINPVALVGTVIGVINMGDPLCGGFAEPFIGKILDLNWHGLIINHIRIFSVHAYQLGLSVLIGYLLLALLCCYFIEETMEVNTEEFYARSSAYVQPQ